MSMMTAEVRRLVAPPELRSHRHADARWCTALGARLD